MKNKFFIWKDGKYNGRNTEWLELTGKEFYEYVTRPENRRRLFTKEYYDPYNRKEGFYKMEATEEAYKKWDAERKKDERTEDVLDAEINKVFFTDKDDVVSERRVKNTPSVVSFESLVKEDSEFTFHDIVPYEENEIETIMDNILLMEVYRVSRFFTKEERDLLDWLYFMNSKDKTECSFAEKYGLTHQAVNIRKKKIIKKLKKIFAFT